jgi:ribosomal protein L21
VVGDPVEETVVETDAVAAVDTAEEIEAETVVVTDAVAAVDTVEETEVETDAVAAATVVITIDAHKATTQIIVMQRENAQGTLTIGDQTTSNRRRTTDTTIDWGLTT